MRKLRPLLFCLTLALCALCLGGCTRDNNDGSGESATSTTETRDNNKETQNDRETDNNRETQNNRETDNNREDNTESSSGVMEGIGDNLETMIDDAATVLDAYNTIC